MTYDSIEDLRLAEKELAEIDRMLDQESDTEIKSALHIASGGLLGGIGGAATGVVGSGTAVFFAGTVGFGVPGITSGLAAIGALVGGGMVAGGSLLLAATGGLALVGVGLGGGAVWLHRKKKFHKARQVLRVHAAARRDFLVKLVNDNTQLGDKLVEYRFHLDRLNRMIVDLDA